MRKIGQLVNLPLPYPQALSQRMTHSDQEYVSHYSAHKPNLMIILFLDSPQIWLYLLGSVKNGGYHKDGFLQDRKNLIF